MKTRADGLRLEMRVWSSGVVSVEVKVVYGMCVFWRVMLMVKTGGVGVRFSILRLRISWRAIPEVAMVRSRVVFRSAQNGLEVIDWVRAERMVGLSVKRLGRVV